MTRREKIAILQSIAEGTATPDALTPAIKYSVIYNIDCDAIYTITEMRLNGRPGLRLNREQFEAWKAGIEAANRHRREPHTISIISFSHDAATSKLFECKGLANCLEGCGCKWREKAM